jgi:hypothetical protein
MSMGCVPVGDDHLSFRRLMSPAKPLPRQDLELILKHTAPLWEEVDCSRIFQTGGPGFFGCWLGELLLCEQSTRPRRCSHHTDA